MRPLEETDLLVGGIPGDSHFGSRSARQLLLVEAETLEELAVDPGQIRENITVRGLPLMSLAVGTRLSVGGAELEVTKECSGCSRMDEIRPGLKDQLVGRRGMYARVVSPGPVRRGDEVRFVAKMSEHVG